MLVVDRSDLARQWHFDPEAVHAEYIESCELLKAEAQNELCRTDQTPISEKSGENDPTRHSSTPGFCAVRAS